MDSSRIRVAIDEQHVALPKLYGAPAYARPVLQVEEAPRPFDPDQLPIEAVQTPEEREIAASLSARSYAPGREPLTEPGHRRATPKNRPLSLNPKPLSLRALAGRILGTGGS